MNIVDKMMENIKINEMVFTFLSLPKRSLFTTARWTPTELYTWMLGNRLVAVSVLYRNAHNLVKMLSRSKVVGRK